MSKNCPKCGSMMNGVKYDSREDVLVSTCATCGFVQKQAPLDKKPTQEEVAFAKLIEESVKDDAQAVQDIQEFIQRDAMIIQQALGDPKKAKILKESLSKMAGSLGINIMGIRL